MEDWLTCYCIPALYMAGVAVSLFLLAYVIYLISIIIFRKIFRKKESLGRRLIEALRWPALVILFELAAIISTSIAPLHENFESMLEHTFVILIIATLGWLLGSLTHAIYLYFTEKLTKEMTINIARRSILTQLLFVYRIVMFAIFIVTVAAILMTFPYIKNVGIGILGSAGIAGIALGIAARPVLLNVIAGFQVAMTKTIKIGDAVLLEGDFAYIETIHLTHVIARTWDMRRIILPISYFIDKPFQNWDTKSQELLGSLLLYCDYSVPVEVIRKKVKELVQSSPHWNGKVWAVHMTDCTEKTVEIRIVMTADDAPKAFELRAYVREKLIEFLQQQYPHVLPCVRYLKIPESPK
ncbi:MAG: mechanosensitive ion channel domain-containing protein [Chlamydiales bacterium]